MRLTEFKDHQRELHAFRLRIGIAGGFVVAAFALLLLRFVYLQIVQYDYYRTKAEDNRISIVPIMPNRGLILDRSGIVLARNYSAYTLEISPGEVTDLEKTIDELASIVEIRPSDRNRFKRLLIESKGADSLPIRTRLTDEEVAQVRRQPLPLSRRRHQGATVPPVPAWTRSPRTCSATSAASTSATSSASTTRA